MPIFEYRCADCDTPYEILHKTSERSDLIECPSCHSKNAVKKFSTFAASVSGSTSADGACATGNCAMPAYSPCASGMCGLN